MVVINLKDLFGEKAKLADLDAYKERAKEVAGSGNEVVLTGQAPIWMYLSIAHALHGRAKKLIYRSPALVNEEPRQVDVTVFDHDAF
jgi:hypothetical protein